MNPAIYKRAMELDPTYTGGSAFLAYGAPLINPSDYGIPFGTGRLRLVYAGEYAVRAKDQVFSKRCLRQGESCRILGEPAELR